MKRFLIIILAALSGLPMAAQLRSSNNGTGYYRIRNVANTLHYITIANDTLNYTIAISTAAGGLMELNGGSLLFGDPAVAAAAKARGLECAGKFLMTDIHMMEDPNCVDVSSIIYLKFKSGAKYDLIAQSTSLIEMTTGTYPGSIVLDFSNIYATITKSSGSGANTQYTAKVDLKASNYSAANLGSRYFIDDNGTFAISESNTDSNAKWILEQVTSFNVDVSSLVEYKGNYYCTMYTPFAYTLSTQNEATVKAYVISAVNEDGTLEKVEVATNESGTVPACTPVILECSSNVLGNCQLMPQDAPKVFPHGEPAISDYSGVNKLKGAFFCNTDGKIYFTTKTGTSFFNADNYTAYNASDMLVLGVGQSPTGVNRLGFFPYTGDKMKSNKVWLDISGSNANANYTLDNDDTNQKGVTNE